MQAGGNRPEDGRPDASTRLRLLSLSTPAGLVEFGGGLACVHARPDARHDVAGSIARAVIGPRTDDIDGTLEIAGRRVELHRLPAPLLRPSAPATIDRSILDELWRRARSQIRVEVQAAHAARRLDRHRTEAAIEHARARAQRLEARAAACAQSIAPPEPEPEPEVACPDEVTLRLEALLELFNDLRPVPS